MLSTPTLSDLADRCVEAVFHERLFLRFFLPSELLERVEYRKFGRTQCRTKSLAVYYAVMRIKTFALRSF